MPAYTDIAAYLIPGHPEEYQTDSVIGNTYVYRGPTAALTAAKPMPVNATWADSRPVATTRLMEFNTASGISELTVTTAATFAPSGTSGQPTLEKTVYGMRWRPVQKPLEVNPSFQDGGAYELDEVALFCIMGWRAEMNPELRSQLKFRQLDSEGQPGEEIDIETESPNAAVFIGFLLKGVEEYTDYLPVWRKRSLYRGQNAPNCEPCGSVETPDGPIPSVITSDYYFVKCADDVESVDDGNRWRRDEEWEGGTQIFADRLEVFPTGIPS